jgi:TrmH family RNA methyltransferase
MAFFIFSNWKQCMFAKSTNIITSSRNWRIVEVRKLRQHKHRQRQGRFYVEGFQLLPTALDSGAKPIEVFYCEENGAGTAEQSLLDRFREAHANLVTVSPHVMEALSERNNPQSIVATFASFETPLKDIDLSRNESELVIVVDRPQSPANLGMIFRSADAVAAAAVILLQPGVDPFHPRAVRVSHGTMFNVPFVQTADVAGIFSWLYQEGFKSVGADPHVGEAWDQDIWEGRVALILGNEVRGMSEEVRAQVKYWTRLPMVGKGESLSSAVAGSVLMYEWFRVNCKTEKGDFYETGENTS